MSLEEIQQLITSEKLPIRSSRCFRICEALRKALFPKIKFELIPDEDNLKFVYITKKFRLQVDVYEKWFHLGILLQDPDVTHHHTFVVTKDEKMKAVDLVSIFSKWTPAIAELVVRVESILKDVSQVSNPDIFIVSSFSAGVRTTLPYHFPSFEIAVKFITELKSQDVDHQGFVVKYQVGKLTSILNQGSDAREQVRMHLRTRE